MLVCASQAEIARVFGALIGLQPVAWVPDGLICAPRIARDDPSPALANCPLPLRPAPWVHGWPDSPAAFVAGWYRRSDQHAPAPAGVRELVQTSGEGFGPADHPTTEMCLRAMDMLDPAAAIDVGCGSGLLAQAWAVRVGAPVLAVDLDPGAVAQTQASAVHAGCGDLVDARRQAIERLSATDLVDRVVFANIPAIAHHLLISRFDAAPRAVVVSGLRPDQAHAVVRAYRRMGLHHVRATRRGRFECHTLVGGR